jgi:hypothetical protein
MATGVGILILYPLSAGPYTWWESRFDPQVNRCIREFYRPLDWPYQHLPKPVAEGFDWYLSRWLPKPRTSYS